MNNKEILVQDYSIEKIIKILWSKKIIILTFTSIALIIAIFSSSKIEPIYKSDIRIYYANYDGSITNQGLTSFKEIEKKFFDQNEFEIWKKKTNSKLDFKEFGVKNFANNKNYFSGNNNVIFYYQSPISIGVKSKNKNLIFEYYEYLVYLINLQKQNYIKSLKEVLEMRKSLVTEEYKPDDNIIEEIVKLQEKIYLYSNNQYQLLVLDQPTVPINVSYPPMRLIFLIIIMGFLVGCLVVLIKSYMNSIKK